VLGHHPPLGQALGARALDELLTHDLEQARAGHPGDGPGVDRSERQRGQDEIRPRPVAVAGHRQPAEPHREEQRQHHPQPEHRGRDPEHRRAHQDLIEEAAGAEGRDHAGGHPQHDRERGGGHRQVHGRGQPLRDDLGHRPLLVVRGAQVAAQQAAHPGEIALVHRAVERVVAPDLLHQLRVRALAEHRPHRVPEPHRGQAEDEQAHADQDRHEREHALGGGLEEVGEHAG
jgi:hypothetical protein